MNSVRFIALILLGLTSLVARADFNGNLNLVNGTDDAWFYSSPLSGGMTSTLGFAPDHTEPRLYTVLVALNVTSLGTAQRPGGSSARLDGAAMTFNSVVFGASTYNYFTFLGLLEGPSHALVFDFSDKAFGAIGSQISVASEPAPTPAPVPEPETWAMLLAGLGVLGHVARKRRATLPA
jgi:PEP-CTERM motif